MLLRKAQQRRPYLLHSSVYYLLARQQRQLSRMIGISPAEQDTLTPSDDVQWITRTIRYCKQSTDCIQTVALKLQALSHPNIVTISDPVESEPGVLIVKELKCSGGLTDYISRAEPIDNKKIMVGIMRGLHYLHSKAKLMHLHISFDSIFIRNGEAAIRLVPLLEAYSEGQDGSIPVGSAPELQSGLYSYQTDIWAVGMIYLQLEIGVKPDFQKKTIQSEITDMLAKVADPKARKVIQAMLSEKADLRPSLENILADLDSPIPKPICSAEKTIKEIDDMLRQFWNLSVSTKKTRSFISSRISVVETEVEKGNPRAMFILGRHYQVSDECKDLAKSRKLLDQAAEAGEVAALANIYYLLDQQKVIDLEFLRKGIALNDFRCCWQMGRQLGYGFDGVAKDETAALELMQKLPSDYPKRFYDIAWLTGKIQGTSTDFPDSLSHLLWRGAGMGDKRCVQALSDYLDDESRYKQAIKVGIIASKLQGECIGDEAQLLSRMGIYYGRVQDRISRRFWMQRGMKQGSKFAKQKYYMSELF